jgi:hypothetical protein
VEAEEGEREESSIEVSRRESSGGSMEIKKIKNGEGFMEAKGGERKEEAQWRLLEN